MLLGSLQNIDFGVFWASWGGSGKEPGPGFDGFQEEVVRGFDGFRQVPGPQGSGFRWARSCEGSRLRRLHSPGLESCRGFEGFGVSGFRWVPRFGKWLRFRRFWSSWFWWVLTVSKVPGPRAAEDMWDQVLAILGLAQCGWQCCAESECICVKRNC